MPRRSWCPRFMAKHFLRQSAASRNQNVREAMSASYFHGFVVRGPLMIREFQRFDAGASFDLTQDHLRLDGLLKEMCRRVTKNLKNNLSLSRSNAQLQWVIPTAAEPQPK